MPTADVNGHPIYFEDTGGDGPAVLFSHGFLMDHEMFAAQVAALAGEFRCIVWDERGFGQTPAGGPFTFWDSAADALALLTHLGVGQAVLSGMSQGGFISLRAALMDPERVKGLALIDTQAGTEDPDVLPGYEALNDEWMANGPGAVQEVVAGLILGEGIDPTPWYAKWATADREQFGLAFRCLADRDDVTGQLGEIRCPAIIFHGDCDQSIPIAKAELLRDGLAGCEGLVVVAGAPHAANMSHPDQVNGPLREFLRRHA
jgi:3-oxoadipate enol-lactonase